jgi:hypothetical protein
MPADNEPIGRNHLSQNGEDAAAPLPDNPKSPRFEPQASSLKSQVPGAWIARAVVALAAIVTALLHVPLQVLPIARDQGTWLTAAMALAHGKVFYRDYLHFNLPATAFAYRLVWLFVSDPRHVAVLLAAINSVMIVLTLYLLLSETMSPAAGAWAALAFGLLWPPRTGWWGIAQKDFLTVPWLFAATWLAARAGPGRRLRRVSLVAAGVCAAVATQFKPTYGLLAVLLAAGLFLRRARSLRAMWKELLADLALFTAGGVLGCAPLLIYLAVHHAFADARLCLIDFGGKYVREHNVSWHGLAKNFFRTQIGLDKGFAFSPGWWWTCIAGIVVWLGSFRRKSRWWLFAPALVAGTSFFIQRKGFGYHMDPWYATLCLFGGVTLALACRFDKLWPPRRQSLVWLALAVVFLFPPVKTARYSLTKREYGRMVAPAWRGEITRHRFLTRNYRLGRDHVLPEQSEMLAVWLRANTRPDETILIWGHECQLYALSDRMYATQAPYDQCLSTFVPGREPPQMTEEKRRFLRLLEVDRPKFIFVATHDANPVEALASDQAIKRVPGFQQYLDEHYTRLPDVKPFLLYQRNP